MKQKKLTYFLAANSCEGFYSVFDKSYLPDGEWRAFIIKGGPGTGKSSFMKRLAAYAESAGLKTVLCPCSSDPDSLDAVILPDKKRVIMDGTAPHTVDPSFPGVCEKILNFGEYWNDSLFSGNEKEVIHATLCNKALHATAATAAGDTTMVVTTSLFGETFRKGFLRRGSGDFLKVGNRLEATARRGGFQLAHSHVYTPSKNSIFSPDARVT